MKPELKPTKPSKEELRVWSSNHPKPIGKKKNFCYQIHDRDQNNAGPSTTKNEIDEIVITKNG